MVKEFEMTKKDFRKLVEACKPVPYIVIGGIKPLSQQDNTNNAWRWLGEKMGFEFMTVKSIVGKGNRFFTAEETK